ncbi:MAG: sulfur transferase domain-containing protein [Pseudomonadota bacterium]
MNRCIRLLLLAAPLFLLAGFAHANDDPPWQLDGQPTVADLEALAAEGVTLVVNTRSVAETAGLDFDERAVVEAHGMTYLHLPIDRERAWLSPARVDALGEALAANDGKALLHCGSGYRAAVLLAAHLVRAEGMSVDAAIERVGRDVARADLDRALGTP